MKVGVGQRSALLFAMLRHRLKDEVRRDPLRTALADGIVVCGESREHAG